MANVELLIEQHAKSFAEQINAVADSAGSEEDVRIEGAKQIDAFIKAAGLSIAGRHEFGLSGGRIDSKYAGVIVEYKSPKGKDRLGDSLGSGGSLRLLSQLESRFDDFSRAGIDAKRIFATGLDGKRIVFMRMRGHAFEADGPYAITELTASRLLRAILSLGASGEAFTPENLVRDFGAASADARTGVQLLYEAIIATRNAKAKTFFDQWTLLFSEVCGYDVSGQHQKVRKLAAHYGVANAKPAELLFSVHTYYAIFMKFLAAQIATSFSEFATSVLRKCSVAPTSSALRREMQSLEQGGLWAHLGLVNFLEGDLFAWYLAAWDPSVARVVRAIAQSLDNYDPLTLSVDPAESRDLLKHLYQELFPRTVRHDLGEYYTPDWLAELTLERSGYDGDPRQRLLDPACGSGTFLVIAINRIKAWFQEHRDECGFGEKQLAAYILSNVVGFDLNPLAVIASRVNVLLAVRDIIRLASGDVEIPVYLCDSIITPEEYTTLFGKGRRLRTAVGSFVIPAEIADDRMRLNKYCEIVESCIKNDYDPNEFIDRITSAALPVTDRAQHIELYDKFQELERKDQNGIWARIIKNAFAPVFLGRVDFIIGNPPWVNWEHMPTDYRENLKKVWERYGLFSLAPGAARLGGGKKDLAMLFVYSCMDKFLSEGGRLAFVIVQTVFKTKGAGDGFRRFRYEDGPRSKWLRPINVDDFSGMQVFEGATNQAAVLVCEKEEAPFAYPVPYTIWRGPSRLSQTLTQNEVSSITQRLSVSATPVLPVSPTSPWLTLPAEVLPSTLKIIGQSRYVAQAGTTTWLNGVFWIEPLKKNSRTVLVRNLHDVGKIKVPSETAIIEADRVLPLLRGRDVSNWIARPSAYILQTQDANTRRGISEREMKRDYPRLYAYLKKFEARLRKRSGYKKYFDRNDPFYSIYNFGPQTLARYKVVWRDMGVTIQAAVVASKRPVCPEHHVMFVPADTEEEAHFICGVLMCSLSKMAIAGYTTSTGISTHVLEVVNVPKFSAKIARHKTIATAAAACKAAAKSSDLVALGEAENTLDEEVAALWSVSSAELVMVRERLAPMLAGRRAEPVGEDSQDNEDDSGEAADTEP